MIIVFTEPSVDSLLSNLNIATHHFNEVNEDLEYCLRRERALEILACRELGVPYVVLDENAYPTTPENEAPILDTNIDLNALPDTFSVAPRWRRSVPLPNQLKTGSLLVSHEQDHNVSHWPESIAEPDRFLKRDAFSVSQAQFNDLMRSASVQPPIFIKGVSKGSSNFSLHHVFDDEAELNSMIMTYADARSLDKQVTFKPHGAKDTDYVAFEAGRPWFCPYREMELISKPGIFNPRDGVIFSDVLEIQRDNGKRLEFRSFIVNGEVTSLSGYVDYESMTVPNQIIEIAEQFAAANAHLAPAFVADFGMTDRGPVLIELNSFDFSGRYLDNNPFDLYKSLTRNVCLEQYSFLEPLPVTDDEEPAFMRAFLDNLDNEGFDHSP